jgi:hypothetical protein
MPGSNEKGVIAEAAIAAEAAKLGFGVLWPMGDERYDVVLDLRPRLLRVQCKSALLKGEVLEVPMRGCWHSPSKGYVRTTYSVEEVDAIGAYCAKTDCCYLLPMTEFAGRTQVLLRLSAARNNQRAAINWAAHYEFRGAVAQLARAPRWQRGGRGFESLQLHLDAD